MGKSGCLSFNSPEVEACDHLSEGLGEGLEHSDVADAEDVARFGWRSSCAHCLWESVCWHCRGPRWSCWLDAFRVAQPRTVSILPACVTTARRLRLLPGIRDGDHGDTCLVTQ